MESGINPGKDISYFQLLPKLTLWGAISNWKSQLQNRIKCVVANGKSFIISDGQEFAIHEFNDNNFMGSLKNVWFIFNVRLVSGAPKHCKLWGIDGRDKNRKVGVFL